MSSCNSLGLTQEFAFKQFIEKAICCHICNNVILNCNHWIGAGFDDSLDNLLPTCDDCYNKLFGGFLNG